MSSSYAFSDLHGRLDLLNKIYEYVKPEDTLYFLGDAADRGPQGWECITTLAADPRVKYLKGNHEDMLVKALRQYLGGNPYGEAYSLLQNNGGEVTFTSAIQEKNIAEWINKLSSLPTYLKLTSKNNQIFYLSHAGYTPGEVLPSNYDLIWNREHFFDFCNQGIVIHGHTPVQLLFKDLNLEKTDKPLWYSNNNKVCLDCGSVWSGHTYLLNLDTLEEIKIS